MASPVLDYNEALTRLKQIIDEVERLDAELARRSLKKFVFLAWKILEPETELKWNWHLDELCRVLESVTRGEIRRVIINVPPGTMKSLLVSVFWPAWEWASMPNRRYLCAAYGQTVSVRDNLKLRDVVTSPWYQRNFKLRLSSDQNAKEKFETTAKGWRIATSVEGTGTGEHPDVIIIDDPINAKKAARVSKTDLKAVITWWKRTVSTRGVTRDVAVIVIMQRLHVEDLSGFLLAQGGWLHVCFPMRYVLTKPHRDGWKPDKRDHRWEPGALLWPELFPHTIVVQLEIDLDQYGAAGQLQQDPVPEGGGLFKRSWFTIIDSAPVHVRRRVRGWDTAATDGDGDWTVGVLISEDLDGWITVEDVCRGQWGPAEVDANMVLCSETDGRYTSIREEKEPGGSGKTVIAAHAVMLYGLDYAGVQVDQDKITRARAYRAECERRKVRLVRAQWNKAYLDELENFPVGTNDDQVDGSSCAYNEVVSGPRAVEQRQVALG